MLETGFYQHSMAMEVVVDPAKIRPRTRCAGRETAPWGPWWRPRRGL